MMGVQGSFARFAIAFAVFLAAAPTSASSDDHPVLGSGNGVDHATLLTRSLVRTSKTFSDMGFTVYPIGSYDNGFENSAIYFGDGTYLELFGVHDEQVVSEGEQSHAVDGPEGLTWVSLETSSMEDTVAYLTARGHDLFGPEAIPDASAWSYKVGGLKSDTLPGHRVYFIEYNHDRLNARRQEKLEAWQLKESHRNGAEGLRAVWVAVRNLDAAEKLYRDSGFTLGRRIELRHLNAVAREIPTRDRAILLIEPGAESPASEFVKSRKASFIGYSIRVRDLARAKSILVENGLSDVAEYTGPYGRSLLVAPAKAGGSWLEVFQ